MKKLQAATRMELLSTKKKIKLTSKGHKLLKEKRDALISEFFSLIEKLKSTRKELESKLENAFKSLILAQAISGSSEVERSAEATPKIHPIESSSKTIMGVKVPVFKWEPKGKQLGYSLISASLELDNAAKNFESVISSVIKLAEYEATVKNLGEEIKKTKRKVNALERILIPRLQENSIYIKMRLEEMERENFSRLKVIKKRIS